MFTRPKSDKNSPVFLKEVKPSNNIYISKIISKKLKPFKGGVLCESKQMD